MDKIYKYIIEKKKSGELSKETSSEIIELLKKERKSSKDLAIIGVSLKTSYADNLLDYWENIKNGRNCIREIPEFRKKDAVNFFNIENSNKSIFKKSSYIDNIDKFDHNFFNISFRDAQAMDPAHRLFLQIAWEAIEDAGSTQDIKNSNTGIFVGFSSNNNYEKIIKSNLSLTNIKLNNRSALLTGRLAHFLNTEGPSMVIDTSCSSSLVALHVACNSIKSGECKMAIVGGLSLKVLPDPISSILDTESKDGITRVFDQKASGTNFGEGIVVVVLKPIEEAIRSNDQIYAVIKGSAVNHDGYSSGLTTPSLRAQEKVLISAWEDAKIDPSTINYIESHGTGTQLGDIIEIEGIKRAFSHYTKKKNFCAIGSVKSNIGHTVEASGLFGLAKAVLSLKYKLLAPNINFDNPNKEIDWLKSPVYVNNKLNKWKRIKLNVPLRCGISSFGISGTNCHVILEEAKNKINTTNNVNNLFLMSAKTKRSLFDLIKKYHEFLLNKKSKKIKLSDICFTLQLGREHYDYRIGLVVKNKKELISKLGKLSINEDKKINNLYCSFSRDKIIIKQKERKKISARGNTLLKNFKKLTSEQYKKLAQIYARGASLEWQLINCEFNKVSLPTYSFEAIRCWPNIPNNNLYHTLTWEKCSQDLNIKDPNFLFDKTVIITDDNLDKNSQIYKIIKKILKHSNDLIVVHLGKRYKKKDDNNYIISNKFSDYNKLINNIKNLNPKRLIYAVHHCYDEFNNKIDIKNNQESGVLGLFRITKALYDNVINPKIDIILLTRNFKKVFPEDKASSICNSAVVGLGREIELEDRSFNVRAIDFDDYTNVNIILQEMILPTRHYQIAFRKDVKYFEKLDKLNIDNYSKNNFSIKSNGCYLITGGFGGIGLELLKYLTSKNERVKIAILGRKNKTKDKNLQNKIKKFNNNGAQIIFFECDVTQKKILEKTINDIQIKLGSIKGVFHAAGIKGKGFLFKENEVNFRDVLSPKLKGTNLVYDLLADKNLDFMILFSSVGSIFPSPGQCGYAAANSYLDAFVQVNFKNNIKNFFTINWSRWLDIGMAAGKDADSNNVFKGLSSLRALSALDDILYRNISNINIIVGELKNKNKDFISNFFSKDIIYDENKNSLPQLLNGRRNNTFTKEEIYLARIWHDVLGIEKIKIDDNFFEMGGDSLKLLHIQNLINDYFGISLSIKILHQNSTVKSLAKYIKQIKNKKFLARDKKTEHKKLTFPLSRSQQRILFMHNLSNNPSLFNVGHIHSINGFVDVKIVEKAINIICNRHDILRVNIFNDKVGNYIQKINLDFNFNVKQINSFNEQEAELFAEKIINTPYDLEKDSLIRINLIKYGDKNFKLVFAHHHVIMDWSSEIIFYREFREIYSRLIQGVKLDKMRHSNQYFDYINFENSKKYLQQIKKQERYWLKVFSGNLPDLNLINDKTSSSQKNYLYKVSTIVLNKKNTDNLVKLSRDYNVSLFVLLLSIYAILLYRITGEEDIIIGTYTNNRNNKKWENMLGVIINIVAIRIKIKDKTPLKKFLKQIQDLVLNSSENKDYPFEKLIKSLKIKPEINHFPLLNTIFQFFDDSQEDKLNFCLDKKHKGKTRSIDNTYGQFDVALRARLNKKKEIEISMGYNPHFFSGKIVNQYLKVFENLVKDVLCDSRQNIDDINIISRENRDKLINLHNNYFRYPKNKFLHNFFEEQAEKKPNKIALEFKNNALTYRQLNERSNKLAHYLRNKKKVRPGTIVAIMFKRSAEMVVGILGVMKSGAAYLPIDPELPNKRIEYMLKQSGAKLLITNKEEIININFENSSINKEQNKISITENFDIVDINNKLVKNARVTNLKKINKLNDLIYVMYTSGSTGKPKGVVVNHKNVINFFYGINKAIPALRKQKTLAFTSFMFDIYFLEIIVPLANGSRVFLLTEDEKRDLFKMSKIVKDQKTNILQFTPSVLNNAIKNSEFIESIKNVENILVGGEIFKKELLESLEKYVNKKVKIYNLYGPTETTIWSTVKRLERNNKNKKNQVISVGKPIINTQVYVLNKQKKILPWGIPGELYISGDGLSEGYVNNQRKSKEVFLKHPFIKDGRIYKTGDIAKINKKEEVEILGRVDKQIKVRGFRIEPEEIELSIKKIKKIKDCIVIKNNNRLVAYYTLSNMKNNLSFFDIKNKLKESLPSYMIPNYFLLVDKMPLSINGKLDTKSLVGIKKENEENKNVEPRNFTEKTLTDIWQEVLNVKNIRIDDNFFDLGGHSLSAMRAVFRINRVFDVKISFQDIFLNPDIKNLSKLVFKKNKTVLPSIYSQPKRENYPLSFAQQRMWFLHKLEPNSSYYNITHQREIEGELDLNIFKKAFLKIIDRHEIISANFKNINNKTVQFINNKHIVDLIFHDLSKSRDLKVKQEKITKIIKHFCNYCFDLENELLLKLVIVKKTFNKFTCLFVAHHIIFDLWSVEVFFKELFQIYNDLVNNNRVTLYPLDYKYFDYALWEQSKENEEIIKKQENFWLNRLNNKVLLVDFPTDKKRPLTQKYDGDTIKIDVKDDIVKKIKKICNQNQITIFTFLFVVYNIFLYRLTGQKDLVVGVPSTDREDLKMENIIGLFVNTLAIRTSIKGDETFKELLKKVNLELLEVYENKKYPFEKLIEKINPERDPSRISAINTMFIFDPYHNQDVKYNNIKIKHKSVYQNINKFDFKLRVSENKNSKMSVTCEYNNHLFASRTISQYLSCFKNIVKEVIKNNELKIYEIPLISQEEKNKLIINYNQTEKKIEKNKTINDLFERAVNKYKNNIAVECGDKKITYADLYSRVVTLANSLKGKINDKCLVCILTERREDLPISVLAVLMQGGSCYLIDKKSYSERTKRIIKNSKTSLVIGVGKNRLDIAGVAYFDINNFKKTPSHKFFKKPIINNDPAFVVYTSGSTGNPKGVVLSHESIINNLTQRIKIANLNDKDILSFNAYTEFISAPLQLLLPLVVGAKLIIYPKEVILNPLKLFYCLDRDNVSAFEIGAYSLQLYINAVKKKQTKKLLLNNLRLLWSSGAKTSTESLCDLHNFYPSKKIIIAYGCSEYSMSLNFLSESGKNIIKTVEGKPTINTQVYILDKHMEPLPPGFIGELYVSGKGMSSGYLNDDIKNKDSFLIHPFIKDTSTDLKYKTKIYKTGDMAIMHHDDNIEILGRMDEQIKLRGFRIEPAEIEHCIRNVEHVKESAVIVYENLLATYYSTDIIKALDPNKIRARLKKYLPDYMIPNIYIYLDKIPRTASGKLDKNSLLNINIKKHLQGYSNIKLKTATEKKIAKIWREVLRIKKIGRNDNFFNLGGHSLKAIQVLSRINSEFRIILDLEEIFIYSFLHEISSRVEIMQKNIKSKMIIKKAKGKVYYV